MGVKVKGGMYCPQCQAPVAAQKTGHGIRNAIATVTAPVGGVMFAAVEGWHCPTCGGPVVSLAAIKRSEERRIARDTPFKEWSLADKAGLIWIGAILLILLIAVIVAAAK